MQDTQHVLLKQYEDLDIKIQKLSAVLNVDTLSEITTLSSEEVYHLTEQLCAMLLYSNALIKRIHASKLDSSKTEP